MAVNSQILATSRGILERQMKSAGDGVWRTTNDGSRVFITNEGEVRAGGPTGKKLDSPKASDSKQGKPKKTSAKVSKAERAAIQEYTGDKFVQINAALRSGKDAVPGDAKIVSLMDSALAKMPKHQGLVFREMEASQELIDQLQPGKTYSDPAFMSTSVNKPQFLHQGKIALQIVGKNGVDISPMSYNEESEREVLFPRNVKFEVVKAQRHKDGAWIAILKETTDSAKSQAKSAGDGIWRTTEDGSKIFITNAGEVRAGGPAGKVIGGTSQQSGKKPIGLASLGEGLIENPPSKYTPGLYSGPGGATESRYRGTYEVDSLTTNVYRVGSIEKNTRRGGVFFGGDPESIEAYASGHGGQPVKEYQVSLGKVIVAGHQDDLTKKWFGKNYGEMMNAARRRHKDATAASSAFDKKLATEAAKRGYEGIVYMSPAPPATTELMVVGDPKQKVKPVGKSEPTEPSDSKPSKSAKTINAADEFKKLPGDVREQIATTWWDSINSDLRTGSPGEFTNSILPKADKLFDHAIESPGFTAYRGVTGQIYPEKPGEKFTDAGFLRASSDKKIGEGFAPPSGTTGQVVTIKVPEGQKYLPGDHLWEQELYFPRNATLKTTAVEYRDNGQDAFGKHHKIAMITAELVPKGRKQKSLTKSCGANAPGGGGFQPGNKCAEGGSGSGSAGSTATAKKPKPAPKKESIGSRIKKWFAGEPKAGQQLQKKLTEPLDDPNLKNAEKFRQAIEKATSKMPDKVAKLAMAGVENVEFFDTARDLTKRAIELHPEMAADIPEGSVIAGLYTDKGQLLLNGGKETGDNEDATHGTYLHELVHALDPADEVAFSDEWLLAWGREMRSGQLTEYGASSPVEGLAEFGRVLYDNGDDAVREAYPRAYSVFKSQGWTK